jgi:hypothetical protein
MSAHTDPSTGDLVDPDWAADLLDHIGAVADDDIYQLSPGSQVIYLSGSTIYRRDGTTGIVTTYTAAATAIQAAIDALGNNGTIYIRDGEYTLGSTQLTVKKGIRIIGESRGASVTTGTILDYTGASVAITGTDLDYFELRNIQVQIAATATGCLLLGDGTVFTKISNVRFKGADKSIAGQYGVNLQSGTYGTFYNTVKDCLFDTLNKGIITSKTGSPSANAQKLLNNNFYNIGAYAMDMSSDQSHSHIIIGGTFAFSANATGIKLDDNYCFVVAFFCEAGTGSKSYELGSNSQENWLLLEDNCPGTPTDSGTRNFIWDIDRTYAATGAATMKNATTSSMITHGLNTTPRIVMLTGSSSDTVDLWVTSVGATQFGMNVSAAVGGDRTVYWEATSRAVR